METFLKSIGENKKGYVRGLLGLMGLFVLMLLATTLYAASGPTGSGDEYRTFMGIGSRNVIWFVAEVHLMFGAFVLGVPIFAVTLEAIGAKTKDPRYDKLSHEFVKLLGGAFSTTAALGGLLAFSLFGLYPRFMGYMFDVFHDVFYVYALIFFGESFTFYLYYYLWDKMQNRKWTHVWLGVLLNVWGTILMMVANSWAGFMMSPVHIDPNTGNFIGTAMQAVGTPLWHPINVHRILGNVAFGGFVGGAYAAVRYLGAQTQAEKAHYDWMGFISNMIAIAGLLPLPFAGYWMGREVYSVSAVMGNNMMGGAFSWTFILQAVLVGTLFIFSNYYLWIGMERIPGSERYSKYIKFIEGILILCFAIWLTPHNLPLNAEEQIALGGQYHPTFKFLGLMAAKNAVINLIILSTFASFLLYRRANKKDGIPFSEQGLRAKITLCGVGALCLAVMGWYGNFMWTADPALYDLPADRAKYFKLPAMLMFIQMGMVFVAIGLTFMNKGKIGQALYLGVGITSITFVLGVYGFIVMAVANPLLRNIAFTQWSMMMTCLLLVSTIDAYLFHGAEEYGQIVWGKMPVRSQYVLILLCIAIVLNIGLMGFIRSGLREDWHIYGVLRDTSQWAFTPTNATMAKMVSACLLVFLGIVSFLFWLTSVDNKGGGHGGEGAHEPAVEPMSVAPNPALSMGMQHRAITGGASGVSAGGLTGGNFSPGTLNISKDEKEI
jgi:cytochrome bd-type quinol oxidase subunit 1